MSLPDSEEESQFVVDTEHQKSLLQALLSKRKATAFTDVTLQAKGVNIPCHKLVLSAASCYFDAMFSSGLKESSSENVEIKDIEPETLAEVIDYIYTGEISITGSNVENIVQACEKFQLQGLKASCDSVMEKYVEPSNCIGFYMFAKMFHLENLLRAAHWCLMTKFEEIVHTSPSSEYQHLTKEELIQIIKEDMSLDNEDSVFLFVLKWAKSDIQSRQPHFAEAMQHVKLPFCTPTFLYHCVEREPLMQSAECQKLLQEAREYQLFAEHRHEIVSPRTVDRRRFPSSRYLVIVGGKDNQDRISNKCSVLRLHSEDLPDKPPQFTANYHVCAVNIGILVTGDMFAKRECWLYIMAEMRWRPIIGMRDARYSHSSVSLGNFAYMLGGCTSSPDRPTSSAEKLDLDLLRWSSLRPMPQAACRTMAVCCGHTIFVLGGEGKNNTHLTYTQAYDIISREWSLKTPMPKAAEGASAVRMNNEIFVVGGSTRACMRYTTDTDNWTKLTRPMKCHRFGSAVVWEGKILLTGGTDENGFVNQDSECFSYERNEWFDYSLPYQRSQMLKEHFLLNLDFHC